MKYTRCNKHSKINCLDCDYITGAESFKKLAKNPDSERRTFAAMILQGMYASGNAGSYGSPEIAAVESADELIKQLNGDN